MITCKYDDLHKRLTLLQVEHEKKKDTLKKLYAVNQAQANQLNNLEQDNTDLKFGMDRTFNKFREATVDVKHVLAERDYLDDRVADIQARHTLDLNRLNTTLTDKEKQLQERDREIDRLKNECRKLIDDYHR